MDENEFYIIINSDSEYSDEDLTDSPGIFDSNDLFFSCLCSLVSYISKIYSDKFARR
jgi:hypothetical protein